MATAKKATAAATTYEVISPLNHNLVDFEVGSVVELTEAEAAPLLGHTVKPTGTGSETAST